MIDGQSADDEVILQVAGVVIGQVDDQVDVTLVDQPVTANETECNRLWSRQCRPQNKSCQSHHVTRLTDLVDLVLKTDQTFK